MINEVKKMERLLLNAIPSRKTILQDNWIIRLNDHYTYRANCAYPLHYSADESVRRELLNCEYIYKKNNMPSVVKVTPILHEGLEETLTRKYYHKVKTVYVMTCDLYSCDVSENLKINSTPSEEWLQASVRLSEVPEECVKVHCDGIKNIGVDTLFVSASCGNQIIGCGYGVFEDGCIGIFDLRVQPEYRGNGIGTSICDILLQYGIEKGAKKGYLIVDSHNDHALDLYEDRGFRKFYEYHYYCRDFDTRKVID